MKNDYALLKENGYRKYGDSLLNDSFKINKKKDDKFEGIIKFYDDEIIKKVIEITITNRLKKIIELILNNEENDDNPPSGLLICLNELEKYQKEISNKYYKYLDKKKKEFINKKISLIEKELKNKIVLYQISNPKKRMIEPKETEKEEEIRRHR